MFQEQKAGVIIPTYNNEKTLEHVIRSVLGYCEQVIVVNDGATDGTAAIIARFPQLIVINHPGNQGKGMALRHGFRKAVELGWEYAITIDSDGQHFPEDFYQFLEKIKEQPGSLIIGARNMNVENIPGKSSFGNKFSNFWFWVETGIRLPDTQSGSRLYPVQRLRKIWFFTTRFEFEIEVIVKAAWRGIPVIQVPVGVYYAPGNERVSHFRPAKDFTRISFLNTWLVILAAFFWRPIMILRGLTWKNVKLIWRRDIVAHNESALKKSLAVGVGLFFGIVPIWGFQLVSAILTAYVLKLNKMIVIVAANISIPPMIPLVLWFSLKTGEWVLGQHVDLDIMKLLSIDTLRNLYVYTIGATVLALMMALAGFLITFGLLKLFKYTPQAEESSLQ